MSAPVTTLQGMVSGGAIDLDNPDWRDINLKDVAYGMAAIRRFNAQARRHICDAEHAGRVAGLVPAPLKLAAELHDAHEAALGDDTLPTTETLIERLMRRFGLRHADVADVIDGIKFGMDVAIARAVLAAYGPPSYRDGWSEAEEAILLAHEMRSPEVRAADRRAAVIEEPLLGRGPGGRSSLPPAPPDDVEAALWLDRVKQACVERYGAPAHG